jgi:hypothetical protein
MLASKIRKVERGREERGRDMANVGKPERRVVVIPAEVPVNPEPVNPEPEKPTQLPAEEPEKVPA